MQNFSGSTPPMPQIPATLTPAENIGGTSNKAVTQLPNVFSLGSEPSPPTGAYGMDTGSLAREISEKVPTLPSSPPPKYTGPLSPPMKAAGSKP